MTIEMLRVIGRWIALVAILSVLGVLLYGVAPPLVAQPPVEMPGGPRDQNDVEQIENLFLGMAPLEQLHFVVQFRRDLTSAEIAAIEAAQQIRLHGPVPEHAYITSTSAQRWANVRGGLEDATPPAARFVLFQPADKLAPPLRDPNDPNEVVIPAYAAVDSDNTAVYVRFFDDVPLTRQLEILNDLAVGAMQAGGAALTRGPTGIWAVIVPNAAIGVLTTFDEVRFIEPTMPPVVNDIDQARVEVGAPALSFDGTGTVVAQFEGCQASTLHPDLADRVTPVGEIPAWCRSWNYHDDQPANNRYDIGETIAMDIDEDGTMDVVLDPPAAPLPADAAWKLMPLRVTKDGDIYLKGTGDNLDVVESGDIAFDTGANYLSAKPTPVATGGEELYARAPERHPTLVAGLIAGNSESQSPGGNPKYPGLVPAASLRSHAWSHSTVVFDYFDAIAAGARISSNSFGWEEDYHYVPLAEPYPGMSRFYDEVSSGRSESGLPSGMPERMLVVGSSGNEGAQPMFWRTGRIVNSAKNVIAVGNVSSSEAGSPGTGLGVPAADSGRGPTIDGRLTPVLSAPGTQLVCDNGFSPWSCVPDIDDDTGGDGGITSTLYVDTYGAVSGTSFSTPIVSGAAALLTQHYEHVCETEPMPQDLRALLVHSARDLTWALNLDEIPSGSVLEGPDFVFGYGLVQVDEASRRVRNVVIDEIETGWVEHRVMVSSLDQLDDVGGELQFRVTLVWDDPPYFAGFPPRATTGILQNDIDLEVIDPDGNRHLPYVLDATPGNEAEPATRKSRAPLMYVLQEWRDHRNTIEQVAVDFETSMLNRNWTIRVREHEVRRGPQAYTLVSKAFTALPGTECGNFSNGSTIYIENPIDVPDTPFAWALFWLAVIILLWLVFEAALFLFEAVLLKYGPLAAYVSVLLFLLLLYLIFWLLVGGSILLLAGLVLLCMAYVLWRATQP